MSGKPSRSSRLRSSPWPLMLASGCAFLACDQAGTAVGAPPSGQSITLGSAAGDGGAGAVTVTYDPSGALSITRGGTVVLASPPGVALLTRTPDPDEPGRLARSRPSCSPT